MRFFSVEIKLVMVTTKILHLILMVYIGVEIVSSSDCDIHFVSTNYSENEIDITTLGKR